MRLQNTLVAGLIAAKGALADGYHYYSDAELTLMGCKGAVWTSSRYCKGDAKASYTCNCKNAPAMGALLNCIYDKTSVYNEEVEDFFIDYCEEVNVNITHAQLRSAYDNATEYLIDGTKTDGFNKTAISYVPVQYNNKQYGIYYQSYKVRWRNVSDSVYMGAGLLGYWLLIIVIATIYNFLQKAGFVGKHFKSGPVNWVRKYITLPSLFANRRHAQPVSFLNVFEGFLPTRWESIVLFGFFVLFFVFSGVRYSYVQDDVIWATREGQASRYPGDRSGILLVFTFQLTFLFAGRNNFLIWLTGWRQATFYTYHKWISRMNFIMTLIHAGSMHCQSIGIGKFHSRIISPWYYTGIIATIAMAIMVVTASYKLRKNYYEIFLGIHIIMAIFALVGSWIHCAKFGFQGGFYATTAVWGFDRLVRVFRIAAFGVQKAQVTVMSDEVLKVVIPKPKHWKAFPGAFGFLGFFTATTFWQSHPFTIVESSETTITFFTKIKGGVTSQIHRHLRSQPGQTGQIRVTVEGPYGNIFPLKRYNTALFYTGGTGIAGPFTQVKGLLSGSKDQHIKLYWIIKSTKSLVWFAEELKSLKDSAAQVIVYITRPDDADLPSSDSSEKNNRSSNDEKSNNELLDSLDFIEFRYGRPSIEQVVQNDIKEANGTVAVVAAAHTSVVDDVRYAVSESLNNNSHRVDYLEALQVW